MRCHDCGERIGVYEPLVVLLDGHARETSRAAATDPAGLRGDCYHRRCYQRRACEAAPGPAPALPPLT